MWLCFCSSVNWTREQWGSIWEEGELVGVALVEREGLAKLEWV